MTTILDKIVADKRIEVESQKKLVSEEELQVRIDRRTVYRSLKKNLQTPGHSGIIAEFKRQSPSKGVINGKVTPTEVSKAYTEAGAACISVLTDKKYFGGTMSDLLEVREANPSTPILRKDFVIDRYQIMEAAAYDADVVLLIAAALTKEEIQEFSELAKALKLEILFEVHNAEELKKQNALIDMIGVNNRNLKDFTVDPERSIELLPLIHKNAVPVSESGISKSETVDHLRTSGFKGFLMGENFMKAENPGEACKAFIKQLKK